MMDSTQKFRLSQNDMEDNVLFLFSPVDEIENAQRIEQDLKKKLSGDSKMPFTVRVGEEI